MPHCRKIACCGQCFADQGSDAGHEVRPAMRHKADATNGSCCPPVRRRSQPGEDIGIHLANFPCIHGRNATHGADPGPKWTRGTTSGQPPESGADGADERSRARRRTAANAAPAANPAPVKSSDDNYKWLIKASAEGYKWAIPAAEITLPLSEKPAGHAGSQARRR